MSEIMNKLCGFKAEISDLSAVFAAMKSGPDRVERVWEAHSGGWETFYRNGSLAIIVIDAKASVDGPFVYLTFRDDGSGKFKGLLGRFDNPHVREWCERQLDAYENGIWPIPSERAT